MKTIGISTLLTSSSLRRMLDALGEVLDVRFEERTVGDDAGIDAWILLDADWEAMRRIIRSNRPHYAVMRDDQRVPCGESSIIEFSSHPALPPVLRGRQIRADEAVGLKSLPLYFDNMTVLASKAGAPVWWMQEVEGWQHHYVSLPIPELIDDEPLFQSFNRKQFLSLLPLFIFLKTLTEDRHWEQPPLQACLMLDDPNLHWRTYGFVDFAEVAAHAQMHNYHVCFATIPLDSWFIHRPTALLFQKYHRQLSLLIHGNDHIARELARPYSDADIDKNLRQALRRIGDFERRSGLEVSRVMAPPHGACSERTLDKMAKLEFEAACVSLGSLRYYNGQASWLHTLGMKSVDIIRELPVFPRFSFSGNCHNTILIAALLHQPIIAMGHHHDLAEGLQLLTDVSALVNSLGTVQWADMRRITRAHYAKRFDGRILRVRMFTRRIEINIPDGTTQILVERPWLKETESTPFVWRLLSEGSEWKYHHRDEPIPVLPCQNIEIAAGLPTSLFIDKKNLRNIHFWPIVRRQLTESRDRLAPLLKHFPAFRSSRIKVKH